MPSVPLPYTSRSGEPMESVYQAILNQQIQAVEHVLYTFCQPAYVRYHNPDERIGQVIQFREVAFVSQPTHLQYVHGETVINVPLLERTALDDRLALSRYLASPFYNASARIETLTGTGGDGYLPITPSASACEQLRKCIEGILQYENAGVLHLWARHINIIDPPVVSWSWNGKIRKYELGRYRSRCPINLFQVFAAGEEPRGIGQQIVEHEEIPRWNPQHIEEPQNLIEAVRAIGGTPPVPETPDADTEAFIAEIDALLAEEDTDELPPEGTLPKAAPTG